MYFRKRVRYVMPTAKIYLLHMISILNKNERKLIRKYVSIESIKLFVFAFTKWIYAKLMLYFISFIFISLQTIWKQLINMRFFSLFSIIFTCERWDIALCKFHKPLGIHRVYETRWKIECNSKLRTDETRNGPCHDRRIIFEYRTNGLRIARIIETLEWNGSVRGLCVDYYSQNRQRFSILIRNKPNEFPSAKFFLMANSENES